jgi:hypothetical protein
MNEGIPVGLSAWSRQNGRVSMDSKGWDKFRFALMPLTGRMEVLKCQWKRVGQKIQRNFKVQPGNIG